MAKYDPTKQEDWQISEGAEEDLNFDAQCDKIGILPTHPLWAGLQRLNSGKGPGRDFVHAVPKRN